MIRTTENEWNHHWEKLSRVLWFLILVHVPYANIEETRFMTYTAASHQGAIKTLFHPAWGPVMLFIFIYSLVWVFSVFGSNSMYFLSFASGLQMDESAVMVIFWALGSFQILSRSERCVDVCHVLVQDLHPPCALPDCNNLSAVQADVIHLGDKDGCHSLIQCGAVHVNGCTYGQHEASHTFINFQILLQAAEGDW